MPNPEALYDAGYAGADTAPWASILGNTNVVGTLGGTIGYNYQFSDHGVVGLEADGAWLSKPGGKSNTFSSASTWSDDGYAGTQSSTSTVSSSAGATSLFTIRPRLGYALDRTLLFVTGGLAIGQVHSATNARFSETSQGAYISCCGGDVGYAGNTTWSGSTNKTMLGWTLGAGVEQALSDHVTLKLDALYYDLGSITTTATGSSAYTYSGYASGPANPSVQPYSQKQTIDGVVVRVGVNYKF